MLNVTVLMFSKRHAQYDLFKVQHKTCSVRPLYIQHKTCSIGLMMILCTLILCVLWCWLFLTWAWNVRAMAPLKKSALRPHYYHHHYTASSMFSTSPAKWQQPRRKIKEAVAGFRPANTWWHFAHLTHHHHSYNNVCIKPIENQWCISKTSP